MTTGRALPLQAERAKAAPATGKQIDRISWLARWLSRLVLLVATLIFTAIAVRYIADPVRTAAAFHITLGSPAAITNMRVGFGAFPLGFAIITFACLVSSRRHLTGLYLVMTVIGAATAARILGIVVDGPAAESLKVLRPEIMMLVLSLAGVFLESARRRAFAAKSV